MHFMPMRYVCLFDDLMLSFLPAAATLSNPTADVSRYRMSPLAAPEN